MMSKDPWKRFFHEHKQKHLNLSNKQPTQFSRAHARLRIAKRFDSILLIDVGEETERGYSTAMAIFLAYSAMEALADAMGQQAHEWEVTDQKLAIKLNKLLADIDLRHPDPQAAIGWLLNNNRLIHQLQSFQAGDHHNVLLIARALRHMVAHGSFTTHGLKMFTKRECDAVEELRQLIFNICDQRLNEWLDAQLVNQMSTTRHTANGGDGCSSGTAEL